MEPHRARLFELALAVKRCLTRPLMLISSLRVPLPCVPPAERLPAKPEPTQRPVPLPPSIPELLLLLPLLDEFGRLLLFLSPHDELSLGLPPMQPRGVPRRSVPCRFK